MKGKKAVQLILGAVLIAALVFLDQWTKQLAVANLKGKDFLVLIPGVLELGYVENRGMAFGLLQDARIFFLVVTTIALGLFLFILIRLPADKRFRPLRLGLLFMVAGAVGNMIDRVVQGYVVDFVYIKLVNFPLFNVADCCVTITAVLLFIVLVFFYKEEDYAKLGL
ncbi:MAG: signal peptidase II [Lachnospiraceae bacterium]|nr:signal peptidase II [Lachnospiraceae bacterium]